MSSAEQQERARRIGDRIVLARRLKGMSQVQLAERMAARSGLEPESARRSLGNNERGKFSPRLRTLQVIAEETDQPISFFLDAPEVASDPGPFRSAA